MFQKKNRSLLNDLDFLSCCGLSLLDYMYTHEYSVVEMAWAVNVFLFPWCNVPFYMHQFLAQVQERPLRKLIAGAIDRLFLACATPDQQYLSIIIGKVGQQYLLDFLQTNGLLVSRHPLELELVECEEWTLMKMPLDKRQCDSVCCKYYSELTATMILHNVHQLRNFGTLMLEIFTYLLYYWRRRLSSDVDADFKSAVAKGGSYSKIFRANEKSSLRFFF